MAFEQTKHAILIYSMEEANMGIWPENQRYLKPPDRTNLSQSPSRMSRGWCVDAAPELCSDSNQDV